MDDSELTERLARDLDGSFEILVRTHVDRCHAIALRVVPGKGPVGADQGVLGDLLGVMRITEDAQRDRVAPVHV